MKQQHWKVVGGTGSGGVLVRHGESTQSQALADRLATGSIVEQRTLNKERLHYQLVEGTGPPEGWISIKASGNALAVRLEDDRGAVQAPASGMPWENWPSTQAAPAYNWPAKEVQANIVSRCERELARPRISWQAVDVQWAMDNYMKICPGMFYGIDFPWNEAMLLSERFGAPWLTKAFIAAGTLDASNAVLEIVNVKRHVQGNNGGKTLFEVRYKDPSPQLHTKLFAKYPFDMDDLKQKADSLAQRVYKQPQDFTEVNFYRLMESFIPFATPKFYYGDVSNENTNFIMITEQVNFNDPRTEAPLAPFQVEGPYDKCMDYQLRGPASEYYYVLVRKGAIMAALHKSGKLAPEHVLEHFEDTSRKSKDDFGCHGGITGDDHFEVKLKMADGFMYEVAAAIFPVEAKEPGFRDRWLTAMRTINAYAAECFYWKAAAFPDYVAFTHQNLNVDNAYFWKDDTGQLDAGIFDWGNQKAMSLGHMFYWWIYVAEWEVMRDHLHGLMDCLIDTYHKEGGPRLDRSTFFTMFLLTALEHNAAIVPTIPLIYKMCPKRAFATITSRRDERLFQPIDGKSTCRVYLHCWGNIIRMFKEWNAAGVLDSWVDSVQRAPFSFAKKDLIALYKLAKYVASGASSPQIVVESMCSSWTQRSSPLKT